MGNQHEILTESRLGWLAGILEGEGCIGLNVRRKGPKERTKVGIDFRLQFINSDGFLIEECVKLIEAITGCRPLIVEHGKTPDRTTSDGVVWRQNRTLMTVVVSRMIHIKEVLLAIVPHMVGEKKARARLMLEFVERRLPYAEASMRVNGKYSDEDWQIVRRFYADKGATFPEELVRDYTRSAALVQ